MSGKQDKTGSEFLQVSEFNNNHCLLKINFSYTLL